MFPRTHFTFLVLCATSSCHRHRQFPVKICIHEISWYTYWFYRHTTMLQTDSNITPSLHGNKCCSYMHQSRIQCRYVIIDILNTQLPWRMTYFVSWMTVKIVSGLKICHIYLETCISHHTCILNYFWGKELLVIWIKNIPQSSSLYLKHANLTFGIHIHYYFISTCSSFEPIYIHNNKWVYCDRVLQTSSKSKTIWTFNNQES